MGGKWWRVGKRKGEGKVGKWERGGGKVGSKGRQEGRGNREMPRFNFVHGSDSFINT